jgi:YesN/AraC family two-component response regulator
MLNVAARKPKILIVDDEPSMVRLLSKFIERKFGDRAHVEGATDPKVAKSIINETIVDILVTDLEMPGISGLEILRTAKRRNAFTQVLFITGHSSHESLLDALELGATDYLVKPVVEDSFVELIGEALQRHHRWRVALSETWRSPSPVPVGEWV